MAKKRPSSTPGPDPDPQQLVHQFLDQHPEILQDPAALADLVQQLMGFAPQPMVDRARGALRPVPPPLPEPLPDPVMVTLRVELEGTKPPVWRRVDVPGDYDLGQLHDVLQASMGWTSTHLHGFLAGSRRRPERRWITQFDLDEGEEGPLETETKVSQVLRAKGDVLLYDYDFGDGWEHRLTVQSVRPGEGEAACLDGRRACPPEDAGGIRAYADIVTALTSGIPLPEHVAEWLGDWQPDEFDVADADAAVKSIGSLMGFVDPHPLVQLLHERVGPVGETWLTTVLAQARLAVLDDAPLTDQEKQQGVWRVGRFLEMAAEGRLPLTDAGYLKPAVLKELAEAMYPGDLWSGAGRRESNTPSVARLRRVAVGAKLVRRHKGQLVPTPLGRRVLAGDLSIWDVLVDRVPVGDNDFGAVCGTFHLLEFAAGRVPALSGSPRFVTILEELGWADVQSYDVLEGIRPTWAVLGVLSDSLWVKKLEPQDRRVAQALAREALNLR